MPDQELSALRTGVRRYVQEWLKEREKGQHVWSMAPMTADTGSVKEMGIWAKAERIRTVVWIGIGGRARPAGDAGSV